MKKLLIFLILLFPIKLISSYEFDCENENIFFINNVKLKEIEVSSFYCDFWKPQNLVVLWNNNAKINSFIKYDKKIKTISKLSKKELEDYLKRLKNDLEIAKNDEELKNKIFKEYTKNYRYYENKLSQFFKKYIFSKRELVKISLEISNNPYKYFEKTYWTRLLMNWKIISREEWGANENYSKREIYMKWCEDGSCYNGPIVKNELKENYLKYFNEIDKFNKKIKTFDDGRDTLNYFPVDRIIIHHTASPYRWIREEGVSYMRALQKYHALNLRWWDIWYHYLIDGEWNIYEWRAWGKYVMWAHVATHNYWSIWIALMSDWYYSPEMLNALQDLIIYLWKEYKLDLTKKTIVRSNDLTWWTEWWVVIAHKELDKRKPKDPEIDMDFFRKEIIAKIENQKKLASTQK